MTVKSRRENEVWMSKGRVFKENETLIKTDESEERSPNVHTVLENDARSQRKHYLEIHSFGKIHSFARLKTKVKLQYLMFK